MNEVDAGSVKAKLNPHPRQRYELTFTIHDAPGPFDSERASIHYEIGNEECVPADAISGAKSKTPNLILAIPLTRLNNNLYRGEVALDLPLDEDYFGLGVCRWMDAGSGIDLKIHDVTFVAGIDQADIEAQKVVSTYFPKAAYSDVESKDRIDHGVPTNYIDYVKEHTEKFFSVAVEAKRIVP